VSFSRDGADWMMIRECYLSDAPTLQVGMMAASPKGDGFTTQFEHFVIAQ
jgi:regulation of enolase protein 1 (concanavalin A-like superfamily)